MTAARNFSPLHAHVIAAYNSCLGCYNLHGAVSVFGESRCALYKRDQDTLTSNDGEWSILYWPKRPTTGRERLRVVSVAVKAYVADTDDSLWCSEGALMVPSLAGPLDLPIDAPWAGC